MDYSKPTIHKDALASCLHRLDALVCDDHKHKVHRDSAAKYIDIFFRTLGHRLTEVVKAYTSHFPEGCVDVDEQMEWVLGMRAELTLANMVWCDGVRSGVVRHSPAACFNTVYQFFFHPAHSHDPTSIPIKWESLLIALLTNPAAAAARTNVFVQLPVWHASQPITPGVDAFIAAVGLTPKSIHWVVQGRVPEMFRCPNSIPPDVLFPWECELVSSEWSQSHPSPRSPHLRHSELDRLLRRAEVLLPNCVTPPDLLPLALLSRATAMNLSVAEPRMTDGLQMQALCAILLNETACVDVLTSKYFTTLTTLERLMSHFKTYAMATLQSSASSGGTLPT
ncbi:hypothetical protein JAAARDRAFT_51765 [Jaapia argillacea MUCL 33604]|uniref:Uncharacterized protein n=1 Tax=Jaapia argillacea MUCL 33604 TaxID=933084 RepID=A0A067P6E4_9AGAM|nr:hypothetical protein JAAARDRAFT_51765 [Jaapia argillacea MUCL 33604]